MDDAFLAFGERADGRGGVFGGEKTETRSERSAWFGSKEVGLAEALALYGAGRPADAHGANVKPRRHLGLSAGGIGFM